MKLSLAIPHAAHRPERRNSLARLRGMLDWTDWHAATIFQDREPHWQWSKKLWRWGFDQGGDALVQLQDDVMVPENFYRIALAMLAAAPKDAEVIALFGIHPIGREIARQGGRWYRTRAWLMGNGYILRQSFLKEFVPWVEANEPLARVTCEDSLINRYCVETGRDVFHPLPSLVEHDLHVASTWAEQARQTWQLDRPENHGHRKAVVSWRDFSPAELSRVDFWEHSGEVRLLADHLGPRCWFCLQEPAFISSQETGVHLGASCVAKMVQEAANRMMLR